jgi:hypothetical protein
MSDFEKEKTDGKNDNREPGVDPVGEAAIDVPPAQAGLRERVWRLLNSAQQRRAGTKQELAKDRTRSLALLVGGIVGAVLLFIGVFSTPTMPLIHETAGRGAPNLGRPSRPNQTATAPRSSVTPLLNADVSSDGDISYQLSPADIQGTSRRTSAAEITSSQVPEVDVRVPRTPLPQTRSLERPVLPSVGGSDPVPAYRLNSSTGVPTYSYAAPATSTAGAEPSRAYSYGAIGAMPAGGRIDTASPKSSIVFVRNPDSTEAATTTLPSSTTPLEQTSLLPPGTRLVARLEAAATTAVKTPVVASIEYNYERDGIIMVPAGTKVLGDVQQASSEGYLSVRFHTMQMPDGREEKIEGAGVGLDQKPLRGVVSGKNTGKKFVSRTLSGVGTIAAYVVGAGGAGLSRTVTGETLLRDRLAGNVALAGEQELMNAAYSQNISVTVPANTRLYVVLQKAALNTTAPAPSRNADANSQPVAIPTVQELRELMDLRREINRMYQESNTSPAGTKP